jgi:hypothetical protein
VIGDEVMMDSLSYKKPFIVSYLISVLSDGCDDSIPQLSVTLAHYSRRSESLDSGGLLNHRKENMMLSNRYARSMAISYYFSVVLALFIPVSRGRSLA